MAEKKKPEKSFSGTEVGALVESFKNDIAAIAEDLGSLREDVGLLKSDMVDVKNDLTFIKDAVRIAVPSLTQRVQKLEEKVGA